MSESPIEALALSDVANTGVLTAVCHGIESRAEEPLLEDPKAGEIMDRLAPVLAASPNKLMRQLAAGEVRGDMVVHLALRARKYDAWAKAFLARHPDGTVVNLGCGLDTRFWRIDDGSFHLYDIDLPEMIALKRELLVETDRYHLIAQSVLDHGWIDRIEAERPGPFIFLAEGLFMYLPQDEVEQLIVELAKRFPGGELVFETVSSLWLKPAMKWMVKVKMQKQLGLGKGTEYRFGIRDAHEPEMWSPGVRLLEEWFYLDEDEERIGFMRRFRDWPLFRGTQWTVRYALSGEPATAKSKDITG